MLIQKTFHDVPVTHGRDARAHMRVFVIAPNVPDYPQARFPGAPPFPACSRTQRS
jgi:carboxymethylenebutenolidase